MASGGVGWSRGLLGLMLMTLGALAELENQLPETLQDLQYVANQNDDDAVYTVPTRVEVQPDDNSPSIRDATLYVLLKELGSQAGQPLDDRRLPRTLDYKIPVFKRLGSSRQSRKGSLPQLCYLKLCAFRRPT